MKNIFKLLEDQRWCFAQVLMVSWEPHQLNKLYYFSSIFVISFFLNVASKTSWEPRIGRIGDANCKLRDEGIYGRLSNIEANDQLPLQVSINHKHCEVAAREQKSLKPLHVHLASCCHHVVIGCFKVLQGISHLLEWPSRGQRVNQDQTTDPYPVIRTFMMTTFVCILYFVIIIISYLLLLLFQTSN